MPMPFVNRPVRGWATRPGRRRWCTGGRPWQPAKDGGAYYTGSFTDPDGNAWEISRLDSLHTI